LATSISLAIVFGVATGAFAVGSYQEYVQRNTRVYDYRLVVQPNATAPEILILPIPGDASLLDGLHLVEGQANWSFADTPHGRGLHVRFVGSVILEAVRSDFGYRNSTPTMINSSRWSFPPDVWMFYSGSGLAHIEFREDDFFMPQSESNRPGWWVYRIGFVCCR
jgi:hypothetical protein